jgi:hypothetical protein
MTRGGPTTLTQDLAQRETDHQRWADDGGRAPDTQHAAPVPAMPVRQVYRRSAGSEPFALSSAPPCTSIPAP